MLVKIHPTDCNGTNKQTDTQTHKQTCYKSPLICMCRYRYLTWIVNIQSKIVFVKLCTCAPFLAPIMQPKKKMNNTKRNWFHWFWGWVLTWVKIFAALFVGGGKVGAKKRTKSLEVMGLHRSWLRLKTLKISLKNFLGARRLRISSFLCWFFSEGCPILPWIMPKDSFLWLHCDDSYPKPQRIETSEDKYVRNLKRYLYLIILWNAWWILVVKDA